MSTKRERSKRSRNTLANKLLRTKIGYQLDPSTKPDKQSIRKSVIKSLKETGWNSKYNNSYQRGKLYTELTEKIAKVQEQDKLTGRELNSVNNNIEYWRDSDEYIKLASPLESGEIDTPITNTNGGIELFEWFEDLDSIRAVNPEFEFQVLVQGTGRVWKGSGADIAKSKSAITAEAKSTGSYLGGGYKMEVDGENQIVKITFNQGEPE